MDLEHSKHGMLGYLFEKFRSRNFWTKKTPTKAGAFIHAGNPLISKMEPRIGFEPTTYAFANALEVPLPIKSYDVVAN